MALRSPIARPARPDATAVAWAYGHRRRGRALTAFSERPGATVREVAERLDEPPRRVRRHLRPLLDAGLVEIAGEEIRGGAVRRRYSGALSEVDYDDTLSDRERIEVAKAILPLLTEGIAPAKAAGTLSRRPDNHEIWMYGEVDHACLEQLAALNQSAYRGIHGALEEGRERVRRSGEPGTEVVSALYFFEVPLWNREKGPPPASTPG